MPCRRPLSAPTPFPGVILSWSSSTCCTSRSRSVRTTSRTRPSRPPPEPSPATGRHKPRGPNDSDAFPPDLIAVCRAGSPPPAGGAVRARIAVRRVCPAYRLTHNGGDRMSHSPDPPSALSPRNVLRGAAAAGLVALPAAGALAGCASSTPSSSSGAGAAKNADNPFGVADGSSVNVVVFDGGLGTEYAEKDKGIFTTKHGKVTVNLGKTQKIKTQEQPKFSTTPSDLINNSGADSMPTDVLVNDGAILDLTDLLDAPTWEGQGTVRDSLLPGTVNDGTYNGKFYTLKYAYTVWGMWY